MVGQQFIALLATHPWFKVTWLGASERSAERRFAMRRRGGCPARCQDDVARLTVETAAPGNAPKLMFSGLDSSLPVRSKAPSRRPAMSSSATRATTGWTRTCAADPRSQPDHLALLKRQEARGWKGRIVTNPNCVVVVYAMALAPLRQFGLKTSILTSLQAISGAGYPGVAVVGHSRHVIPFIGGGEEEKIETERTRFSAR